MKTNLLKELSILRTEKTPTCLLTNLETGVQELITDIAASTLSSEQKAEIERALRQNKSRELTPGSDGERLFIQVFNPPKRMIIIGAVHITQALYPMAQMLGFEVVVVDPRDAWATDERFPGVELDRRWPDEALEQLAINSRTAIVTLTHDPKLDDPALELAIRSDAFYVGALGSRKTHGKRQDRLRERGFSEEEMARICAPIGLDIGALSPAEISVAVLGEITLALNGPKH